jgi:hypothetical protein
VSDVNIPDSIRPGYLRWRIGAWLIGPSVERGRRAHHLQGRDMAYFFGSEDRSTSIENGVWWGLHFSVNHPVNGDPWEHSFEIDFDSLEVWNALYVAPSSNIKAIALWDGLRAGGRWHTARGGSDVHHQVGFESTILNVGNPTTLLPASEAQRQSSKPLKAGRARSAGAVGRTTDFVADADGDGVSRPSSAATSTGRSDDPFRIEIVGFCEEHLRYHGA